ncbi:MAG: 6-bladed beta-propeller [Coriobacteriia bacterium]
MTLKRPHRDRAGRTRRDDTTIDHRARRTMIAIVIIVVLLLLAASALLFWVAKPVGTIARGEQAGGLEWVQSIYGWGETEGEQLLTPNDVAIGPDGTIWVTDQARGRVVAFHPDGTYKTLLHQGPVGSSPFALEMPTSVAVDETGLIYVGELAGDSVTVFNDDNEVVRQYVVPDVSAVAARDGRVVAGSRAGFIIFDTEGEVIQLVGEQGSGDGQFDGVAGITIAEDGTIFVSDQFNNRISAYDRDGEHLWTREMGLPNNTGMNAGMSEETTAEAKMALPARMTTDGAGRLVVADPFDFSLTVLDAEDGDLLAKYGAMGSADGQFTYPNGVSYDPERDWFAVADSANSRVQIVRLPDSGNAPLASVQRSLAGPLRTCIVPLLLILVIVIVWAVREIVARRRRRNDAEHDSSSLEADPVIAAEGSAAE